jgi:hypothetical protein
MKIIGPFFVQILSNLLFVQPMSNRTSSLKHSRTTHPPVWTTTSGVDWAFRFWQDVFSLEDR